MRRRRVRVAKAVSNVRNLQFVPREGKARREAVINSGETEPDDDDKKPLYPKT